ncbi:hypothetical protein [Companilactobacillus kedongensis]|uniref:hypothetical protein n=1 Tax=Companilactobacillus kedongensis TaxID=2486004 RepID=UPI000F78AFA9|nr:hypothetical protein [Companilactobacillus kedongensis]
MKKKIMGSIVVAGMAAVTIGALSNLTNVSAAGVATTFDKIVRMYKPNGDLVTNRALGAHTPWQVGKTRTINGETMYQVSTSEFVKAGDVSYDANPGGNTDTNTNTDNKPNSNVVITTNYSIGYNDNDGTTTDGHINSKNPDLIGSFKVGRIVKSSIGTFYQVSTHTWINGDGMVDGDGDDYYIPKVTGDQTIEYDDNFSPVGNTVLGMTADGIRNMLTNDYQCDATALAAVPDNWLLFHYADVVEAGDQPDTGFVAVINETYPDVHGYSFGFWVE